MALMNPAVQGKLPQPLLKQSYHSLSNSSDGILKSI